MSKQSKLLKIRDESLDRLAMEIARVMVAHRKAFRGLDLNVHTFKILRRDDDFLHDLLIQVFDHKREGRE